MSNITSSPDGIAGEVSHETLHLFWMVDVSGSMEGNKIQTVNYAIKLVMPEIQRIEDEERVKVFIRTIIFSDYADWLGGDEPIEASQFIWKDMNVTRGLTGTAQAIDLLRNALDVNKIGLRNAPPVWILLSDGYCTDDKNDYNEAIKKLNSHPWGAKAVRLSIGIGDRESYNKEQLDQFVSPYLSKEKGIETLPADTPRKLVEFIILAATTAIVKSSTTHGDVHLSMPVDINVEELYDSDVLDPENLPDPHKVY